MAVEQVHQRVVDRAWVILTNGFESSCKLRGRNGVPTIAESLCVEILWRQETHNRVPDAIIHGRVRPSSAKESEQGAVLLPKFADDKGIRLGLLHYLPERLPIAIREGCITHYV